MIQALVAGGEKLGREKYLNVECGRCGRVEYSGWLEVDIQYSEEINCVMTAMQRIIEELYMVIKFKK